MGSAASSATGENKPWTAVNIIGGVNSPVKSLKTAGGRILSQRKSNKDIRASLKKERRASQRPELAQASAATRIKVLEGLEASKLDIEHNLNEFGPRSSAPHKRCFSVLTEVLKGESSVLDVGINLDASTAADMGILYAEFALKRLPQMLQRITWLTTLKANNNQLQELPTWVGNLSLLTELSLNQNNLCWLPSQLSLLTNLESLDVSRNKIKLLPDNLPRSLRFFDASQNLIKKLPDITEFALLQKLASCPSSFHLTRGDEHTSGSLTDAHLFSLAQCDRSLRRIRSKAHQPASQRRASMQFGAFSCVCAASVSRRRVPCCMPPPLECNVFCCSAACIPAYTHVRAYTPACAAAAATAAATATAASQQAELEMAGSVKCSRLKVVLVGDGEAGKTSLLRALSKGKPSPTLPSERTVAIDAHEPIHLQTETKDVGGLELVFQLHCQLAHPSQHRQTLLFSTITQYKRESNVLG